jgi:hypothetical protein
MNRNVKHRYPLQYTGNVILFIICAILFFPLGIVLAIKNMKILRDNKYLRLSYRGSYGWLIFWTILFFPIAILMLLINGVDIEEG